MTNAMTCKTAVPSDRGRGSPTSGSKWPARCARRDGRFKSVDRNRVTFSFTGEFVHYDGDGGESETTVSASSSGTAHAVTD
jgi:hypothetical protein